jgi:prepilin-type N-terminal cleavage/methylation domain-containing protein
MIICYNAYMKRRAFTLVELLVVIAIIGLLSTIAIVALGSSRTKARNAKRNADIKQIANAFDFGVSANGSLPLGSGCLSTACGGGWESVAPSATVDAFLAPYIPSKPTDPLESVRTVSGYTYNSAFNIGGGDFPALSWFNEGPSSATICGPGLVVYSANGQTQCYLQLNQ